MKSRYIFTKPRWNNTTTTPAGIVIPNTKQAFFGANIHIKYGDGTGTAVNNYPQGLTAQQYVDKALDLGIRWYRTNCNTAANIIAERPYFTLMRANNIEPFVVIDAGINLSNSYATNYSGGLALGQAIGNAAAGYVTYFETSNEIDFNCRLDKQGQTGRSGLDGSQRTDFYQPALDAWMGWNTGVLDGLRQYIPDAQIGYATGAGFGAYIVGEMWKKGLNNQGVQVRAPVDVSFMGLHWYTSMGNPRSATPNGGSTLNVMQEIWNRMGVPTFVTEWGSSINDAGTDAAQATQLTTFANFYWPNRVADHVAGVFFYAMFPNPSNEGDNPVSPNWGLIQADGSTIKQSYTAYKNYIAS